MNQQNDLYEIKSRFRDYLRPARKSGFICPLCSNGEGTDGDGMSIDPHGDGTQLKCFRCGFYGDIIDLYQAEHHAEAGEAIRSLRDLFGLSDNGRTAGASEQPRTTANNVRNARQEPDEHRANDRQIPDFSAYYEKCRAHIEDDPAREYLSFRGISVSTAKRYGLGYDPDAGFIIVPCSPSSYVGRNTDRVSPQRYKNAPGTPIDLFNAAALSNDAGRPVFITEGAFDALSIIEAGGEAVGLNGTGNARKLLQHVKQNKPAGTLILCLDKDPPRKDEQGKDVGEAGQKAEELLADGLRDANISFISYDVTDKHKDPNEALTEGRSSFLRAVKAAERATSKPDNMEDYITRELQKEIEKQEAQTGRKTGFSNLDEEIGSIYAGLYVIGGISSVGKTTFAAQIADQMAEQGQHVLFFSMEQSRLEMASKSIARQATRINDKEALTSLQIRNGASNRTTAEAVLAYMAAVKDRLSVIEGNFSCTVDYIREYVQKYIERNAGARPVVLVDYLQVIQPGADPVTRRKPTDPKQAVDLNITELKRMSRRLDVPVILISSVNRSNYQSVIDFEAFKESGAIEYTADVVFGLQLSVMHDDIFDKEKGVNEKREKIAEAKSKTPREIELVCLKNRYGKSRFTCDFWYYPQHDYFIPKQTTERKEVRSRRI